MRVPWDDPAVAPEVRQTWGEFVRDHASWTWWVTVTFRVALSHKAAMREFRAWAHLLAKEVVQGHFSVALAVEPHQGHGGYHVHALLAFPGDSPADEATLRSALGRASTFAGITTIERYDPQQRAPWYVAKQECMVTVACPRTGKCKREGTCVVSSSPWPLS